MGSSALFRDKAKVRALNTVNSDNAKLVFGDNCLTRLGFLCSTGARDRDQPGKPRVWCWSGCELVRVRGCELTSGVRIDSGASWYWGGLTRKRERLNGLA